jgi:hypothetical protein
MVRGDFLRSASFTGYLILFVSLILMVFYQNAETFAAGSLNLILVVNCPIEHDFELCFAWIQHDFLIRHQYHFAEEPYIVPPHYRHSVIPPETNLGPADLVGSAA